MLSALDQAALARGGVGEQAEGPEVELGHLARCRVRHADCVPRRGAQPAGDDQY